MEDINRLNEACIYTRDLWSLYINRRNVINEKFNSMTERMKLYTDGEYVVNRKDHSYVFAADFIRLYEIKGGNITSKEFEHLYLTAQKNTDRMIFLNESGFMKRNVTDRQMKEIVGNGIKG